MDTLLGSSFVNFFTVFINFSLLARIWAFSTKDFSTLSRICSATIQRNFFSNSRKWLGWERLTWLMLSPRSAFDFHLPWNLKERGPAPLLGYFRAFRFLGETLLHFNVLRGTIKTGRSISTFFWEFTSFRFCRLASIVLPYWHLLSSSHFFVLDTVIQIRMALIDFHGLVQILFVLYEFG